MASRMADEDLATAVAISLVNECGERAARTLEEDGVIGR